MAIVEAPTTLERIFLAGEWAETGSSFEVHSPYSGEVVATVARAGAEEGPACTIREMTEERLVVLGGV